jgi:DNA invertase Pin-like site-specific DNA recombinase
MAKLSPRAVVEIRRKFASGGVLQHELADRFGVSRELIGQIIQRKIWANAEQEASEISSSSSAERCLVDEKWAVVPRSDGRYQVSSKGRIRGLRSGKILKISQSSDAHESVMLRIGGESFNWPVHRIVMAAFEGPAPEDRPLVRHLDGDPTNNHLENLCYGTAQENWRDTVRHGTAAIEEDHPGAKLTVAQVEAIRREYASTPVNMTELSEKYGVDAGTIRPIVTGKTWRTVGVKYQNAIDDKRRRREYNWRASKGSAHPRSTLTETDVKKIKELFARDGISKTAIAKQFSIDVTTVKQIVKGRSWKHVAPELTVVEERRQQGSKHPVSKLDEEKVLSILEKYAAGGTSYAALGKEYGVDRSVIRRIVRGESWKHVKRPQ